MKRGRYASRAMVCRRLCVVALAGLVLACGCERKAPRPGGGTGRLMPAAGTEAPAEAGAGKEAPATRVTRPIDVPSNPAGSLGPNLDELAAEPYDSSATETAAATEGGRTKVRPLMSFEDDPEGHEQDGKPVPYLMQSADDMDAIYVQDNGVTDGRWCARLTIPAGKRWGSVTIRGDFLKDWSDYDYFAVDVYVDDDHPYHFAFELWDGLSKDYHTRCTYEDVKTRRGRQTLLYPINRARRNGKGGLGWNQLAPEDKIDLDGLTQIKLISSPLKDRPAVFWVDNLRLLQEDAAKPKLAIALPKAAAFNFGSPGAAIDGFRTVSPGLLFADEAGPGFTQGDGLEARGTGWPDLLAGTFVLGARNKPFEFKARVPNGEYRVWLCAGPVLDVNNPTPRFLLRLGSKALVEDSPSFSQYDGEEYLYRFLWTQYSQRPHALWLDYIDRMYPVFEETVRVTDGVLSLVACDCFVSGLIAVPVAQEKDFSRMAARIQKARIEAFETANPVSYKRAPVRIDGDYLLYVPDSWRTVRPDSAPSAGEIDSRDLSAVAAPGENVFLRVAVTPARDLGACELRLSNLTGPAGTIPAESVTGHYQNYRWERHGTGEMALVPSLALNMEKGLTQCFWLWLEVPEDAAPGSYSGTFTFVSTNAGSTEIPVTVEVHPFRLEEDLPVSLFMYYSGRSAPRPPDDVYWQVIKDQFLWMRKIGLTSTTIMGDARVARLDSRDGSTQMRFDRKCWDVAKEAGLGRTPEQMLVASYQLGLSRAVARWLFPVEEGVSPVDSQPGIEFTHAEFKPYWMSAMRQYKEFLDSLGQPYLMYVVDEPREVPNPWNRNLKDTITYLDWSAEVGFDSRFITPMGDTQSGLDYTALVDHCDVMSSHASPASRRLMQKTKEQGKKLAFYNCGMSRFVWGFYLWSQGAVSYSQWHWCFPDGEAAGGYPGREWYNPFTPYNALASNAPVSKYPGGFLYKSAFLSAAEGITDYAYVHTLELSIKEHKAAGTKADVVARAEALLDGIRKGCPEFPHGEGVPEVERKLDSWRAQIAGLLGALAE